MSTESQSQTPTPAAPPTRSKLRRAAIASALVFSGVIVGIGATALSQGHGPRGWHDRPFGWSERGGPYGGPHSWFDRDGYRSGPHGWSDEFGGPFMGRFSGAGPRFFTPGRVERVIDRVLSTVDASSDQRQKILAIAQRAGEDVRALRDKHLDGRKQMAEILSAQTIDRAKLEAVRSEQFKLAEAASKQLVAAVAEAGEVLTPSQRADLGRLIEARRRWFRG